MFNDKDFDDIERQNNEAPDGVMDASDYLEHMENITKMLEDTDYSDLTSRITTMMNVMNYIHDDDEELDVDKMYASIIAMLYHIHALFIGIDDDDREAYFKAFYEEHLPIMKDESKTLPYWDDNDEDS